MRYNWKLWTAFVLTLMWVSTLTMFAQTVVYNPNQSMTDCNLIPGQCQTYYPDGTVITTFTQDTADPKVDTSTPSPASMFKVGAVIGVVWDCLPAFTVPPGGSPCYGEVLQVLALRANGWLDVLDEAGDTWTVNPLRMIGWQPAPLPTVAKGYGRELYGVERSISTVGFDARSTMR